MSSGMERDEGDLARRVADAVEEPGGPVGGRMREDEEGAIVYPL